MGTVITLPVIMVVPSVSTEYVVAEVEGFERGRPVNPTNMGVWFAYTQDEDTPGLNDWHQGDWDVAHRTYFARGLFGPESEVTLAPGDWVVWLRLVANPERPARRLGLLRVT